MTKEVSQSKRGINHMSERKKEQLARQYAEGWWQALRAWEVASRQEPIPPVGRKGQRVGTSTLGYQQGPNGWIIYRSVSTPIGWISESALARALSESGDHLEKLRRGTAAQSLCRAEGGWEAPKARFVGYAVQVLELAVSLGDKEALKHLEAIRV